MRCPFPDHQPLRGTSPSTIAFISAAGLFTLDILAEVANLLPMMLLGIWLGIRYFRASSVGEFYTTLNLVLLLATLAPMVKRAAAVI